MVLTCQKERWPHLASNSFDLLSSDAHHKQREHNPLLRPVDMTTPLDAALSTQKHDCWRISPACKAFRKQPKRREPAAEVAPDAPGEHCCNHAHSSGSWRLAESARVPPDQSANTSGAQRPIGPRNRFAKGPGSQRVRANPAITSGLLQRRGGARLYRLAPKRKQVFWQPPQSMKSLCISK